MNAYQIEIYGAYSVVVKYLCIDNDTINGFGLWCQNKKADFRFVHFFIKKKSPENISAVDCNFASKSMIQINYDPFINVQIQIYGNNESTET